MVVSRIGSLVTRFEHVPITPEAVRAFRERGFLAVADLLAPEDVEDAASLVRPLLVDPVPRAEGMLFDYAGPDGDPTRATVLQLLLPFDYAPALFDTRFFARAAGLARALLPEPIRYRGSHFVAKPPGLDNPTPLHQDEAYWDPSCVHEAIGVWMPLTAVGPEHGCMRFLPRPIADETIFEHRHIGGDPRVHGLELADERFSESDAVEEPLPLGGVTVHHCRSIHGTGPNRTRATREALVINFAGPARALDEPRDFRWQRSTNNERDRTRRDRGIELP